MNRILRVTAMICALTACDAFAWWPFGDDDDAKPRISLLMKPVNEMIDRAEDRKGEGKYSEAVDAYREALNELANVEYANPDLVDSPAFSTVKNKRAYIKAAITTLQLREAGEEDGLVTLSDPSELEKLIEGQRDREKKDAEKKAQAAAAAAAKSNAVARATSKAAPRGLSEVGKLNRRAATLMEQGDLAAAETTLKAAIRKFPENHHAYYNLAKLMKAQGRPADEVAEIYLAGLAVGGPKDAELEAVRGSVE